MKKLIISLLSVLLYVTSVHAQKLMPYTLGEELTQGMDEAKKSVNSSLETNGFELIGSYQVAGDQNRWLIAVTSPEMNSIVNKLGGKKGYFAALRVAITIEGGKALVSYTTPRYWANAYLQSSVKTVDGDIIKLESRFKKTFSMNKPFGSKKGLSIKKLKKYNYMFGMPNFEDDVTLGEFKSYVDAVSSIDSELKSSTNLKLVYQMAFPKRAIKLYGVAISGDKGESKFLPIIDKSNPKHTAFLPYELLVYKNKAYMMHGRFRIALAFPDLTMGTFMKIMSAPGDIEGALKSVCK